MLGNLEKNLSTALVKIVFWIGEEIKYNKNRERQKGKLKITLEKKQNQEEQKITALRWLITLKWKFKLKISLPLIASCKFTVFKIMLYLSPQILLKLILHWWTDFMWSSMRNVFFFSWMENFGLEMWLYMFGNGL